MAHVNVLWLDDVRPPWKFGYTGATWVKTAAECIKELQTGNYDFASLDHDLAEEHYPWNCEDIESCKGTGYDVTCWLEDNPEFWPRLGTAVHSMNPVGRKRMEYVVWRHYNRNFTQPYREIR